MAGDDQRSWATRLHDHSQSYESTVSVGSVPHANTTGQTTDDHHAKSHAHNGADGSGTVAHGDLTGVGANDHHTQSHDHSLGADGSTLNPGVLNVPGYGVGGAAAGEFWMVESGGVPTGTMKLWDGSAGHDFVPAASTVPEDLALGDTAASGGGAVVSEVAWIDHVHGMPTAAQVGAALVLDDISDVTETTITTGDLLRWNGSAWVNYADSAYEPAVSQGTSFPGSPSTGDQYYRTDIRGGLLFRYDGTRWLSDQLFTVNTTDDEPGSTAATNKRIVLPDDYDVYLVCWDINHRSDTGTPESITVDIATLDEAGGSSTLDTWTATPAVASRWYSTTRTLGDLVTSSSGDDTTLRIQKSATSSTASYAAATVHYRLKAT